MKGKKNKFLSELMVTSAVRLQGKGSISLHVKSKYGYDQSISLLLKLNTQLESNVCMASKAKTHKSQQHPEMCKKYLDVTQRPRTEVIC